MKTFSLIIPVYRPDARFVEQMRRVAAQRALPERIVLMETVSGEGEAALREALTILAGAGFCEETGTLVNRKVTRADFDHGGTRDAAARLCDTDLMAFMTMDALPATRTLFENLLTPFADPLVACAYARQLPETGAGAVERFTRSFNYPKESKRKTEDDLGTLGIKTFFCSNVCAAYRRDIYLELGGFEKRTIFNEDMIFAGKAVQNGYAVYYEAGAMVIHSHNYTGMMQLHRNFDLGVSQAQHPEVFAFAKSDSEGIRLVKETMRYLAASGRAEKIPGLIWQSACKYLGYRLGKAYERLPRGAVKRLSLNRSYWDR